MTRPDMITDYVAHCRFYEVVQAAHAARLERQRRLDEAGPDWSARIMVRLSSGTQQLKAGLQLLVAGPILTRK